MIRLKSVFATPLTAPGHYKCHSKNDCFCWKKKTGTVGTTKKLFFCSIIMNEKEDRKKKKTVNLAAPVATTKNS